MFESIRSLVGVRQADFYTRKVFDVDLYTSATLSYIFI